MARPPVFPAEEKVRVVLSILAGEIFERIIAVASGEPTVSEELDIGQEEFVPWQLATVT
jgi:altronate hydrolase